MGMDEFSAMIDRTGLKLSASQKDVLFGAYPLFEAMIARATPDLPREAEPAMIFLPEVK